MSDAATDEYSSPDPTVRITGEMYTSGVNTPGMSHMAKYVARGTAITPPTESKRVPDTKVRVSQNSIETARTATPARKFRGDGQPPGAKIPMVT